MKDPRSHRRYKDAARAWIASMGGQAVTCCLCGQPCDTALPGSHPYGPTVEHQPPVRYIVAMARDYSDAVAMVANPSHWAGIAHRRCQNRQGGASSLERVARQRPRGFTPSRMW